jgi:hypothetical protein
MPPAADLDEGADEPEQTGDARSIDTDPIPVIEGHAVRFNEYRY